MYDICIYAYIYIYTNIYIYIYGDSLRDLRGTCGMFSPLKVATQGRHSRSPLKVATQGRHSRWPLYVKTVTRYTIVRIVC